MFVQPKDYLSVHETERMLLRPATMDDAQVWSEFHLDPIAMQYYPDSAKGGIEVAQNWLTRLLDRYEAGTFGFLCLEEKETGRYLGQCGLLTQEVDGKQLLEVGYALLRSAWGKGYATEAAQWFRNYAFQHELSDTVVSLIHPDNVPSQRVAERNGMTRERMTHWREIDIYIYAITRTAWVQAYQ